MNAQDRRAGGGEGVEAMTYTCLSCENKCLRRPHPNRNLRPWCRVLSIWVWADARAMTCPHLRLPVPFADPDGIDEPDEDYLL